MAKSYFCSGNGQDKQVRSTTGHSFLIGDKPVAVPDVGTLHDDCMRAGCYVVEGYAPEVTEADTPPVEVAPAETEAEVAARAAMLEESDNLFPVPAPKVKA